MLQIALQVGNDGILFTWSVPFDEDEKDSSVWFVDHMFVENMFAMFKKVSGISHRDIVDEFSERSYRRMVQLITKAALQRPCNQ